VSRLECGSLVIPGALQLEHHEGENIQTGNGCCGPMQSAFPLLHNHISASIVHNYWGMT
jgi:hypothetical protein